jgi:hypothetical protein
MATVITFKMSPQRRNAAERWINFLRVRDQALAAARQFADLGHRELTVRAMVLEARTANRMALRCKLFAREGQ